MQVATQLSLLLANKPGTLAAVCRTLTKAEISVNALTISETVDHSIIRMVVSKPHPALRLLEDYGTLVLENEVLVLEEQNKAGVLENICEKLGNGGVNIEYVYFSTSAHAQNVTIILRPDNIAKALKALNKRAEGLKIHSSGKKRE